MTNNKWILPAIIAVVAVVGLGSWTYHTSGDASEADGDIVANESLAPAAGEETTPTLEGAPATEEAAVTEGPTSTPETAAATDIHPVVDASTPEGPRSLGSIDAPITMVEYSSLTCPHCASAHAKVLPQLIKDYVDTGKVRIVFSDFPLNKEALDASKVSRCVANDQYFNFLTLLFGDIEKWAYSGNHPEALITDATLTGLSADKARTCLNDKELEDSLMAAVQDAAEKKGVNSTPTFIFNDGAATIQGARPYAEFKATIDELLAKSGK
ncbi:MAG TPA: DsbA family protein [Alphaproteobacteria bacterium]